MNKVQVSLREVEELQSRRREINSLPIEQIEWLRDDGSVVEVAPETLEEWRFTGLTNLCFIETGFYKYPETN